MAAGGIQDILIANMIVGQPKCERVAGLCGNADPIIAIDHYAQAEPLAAACHAKGVSCRAILEVDIGLNRVGVRPGKDAMELAQGIEKLECLDFVGIMGCEGHLLRVEDPQ